jgi:hypothetical protein
MNVRANSGAGKRVTEMDVLNVDIHNGKPTFTERNNLETFEENIVKGAFLHCPNVQKGTGAAKYVGFEGEVGSKRGDETRNHFIGEAYTPLLLNFNFKANTDQLSGNNASTFDNIVKYLQENPDMNLVISGTSNLSLNENADITTNGSSHNSSVNELTGARADKIINTLVNDYGVDRKRLVKGDSYTQENSQAATVTPEKANDNKDEK